MRKRFVFPRGNWKCGAAEQQEKRGGYLGCMEMIER